MWTICRLTFLFSLVLAFCLLKAGHAYADDTAPFRVLAIGQSNMEGRFGPAAAPSDSAARIFAWNWSVEEWAPAVLGSIPFRPLFAGSGAANNLSYVFANEISQECDIDVYTVLLASGGKRIEYFLPNFVLRDNGWENNQSDSRFGNSLADEIMGQDGTAAVALRSSGGGVFDAVLIHQGEANNLDIIEEPGVYQAQIRALISELRRRRLVGDDTAIIVGGINPGYPGGEAHQLAINELRHEGIGVVSWQGVEDVGDIIGDNNQHATGRGLTELGIRYFEEFMRLSGDCPN